MTFSLATIEMLMPEQAEEEAKRALSQASQGSQAGMQPARSVTGPHRLTSAHSQAPAESSHSHTRGAGSAAPEHEHEHGAVSQQDTEMQRKHEQRRQLPEPQAEAVGGHGEDVGETVQKYLWECLLLQHCGRWPGQQARVCELASTACV